MMYVRVISNELGEIEYYCSELSEDEIEEIMDIHPEWMIKCVEVSE